MALVKLGEMVGEISSTRSPEVVSGSCAFVSSAAMGAITIPPWHGPLQLQLTMGSVAGGRGGKTERRSMAEPAPRRLSKHKKLTEKGSLSSRLRAAPPPYGLPDRH